MHLLIAIDDTDNLESLGTGKIATILAQKISARGLGTCGKVTRHQLLLDPRIPYTSHNSSMCFPAEVAAEALDRVIETCGAELADVSAAEADPGLCVATLETLAAPEDLIAFGQRAKREVLAKDDAYAAAAALGVHLSEHGGTGQGVIGALAGAGLRLSGNDGRFAGKTAIASRQGLASVREIRQTGIDLVQPENGTPLDDDALVGVDAWIKPVLLAGKSVLLVVSDARRENGWKACDRTVFRRY